MPYRVLQNSIVTSLILFLTLLFSSIESVAQIKLAWDPNTEPDVAGYRVYYGTASRTYGAPINVGNVTSYTVTGLTIGATYYFAVTAYDTADTAYNESGFSNEVYATVTETVRSPTVLSGPTSGITGASCAYTAGGASSNLGHSVQYQFDWKGDGTVLSPWGSGTQSMTWTAAGTYHVRARARCATHPSVVSLWSGSVTVSITNATGVSYTVTTNPSGRPVIVDGSTYTAPRTFNWPVGSSHTLSVSSPQNGASGTRYVYTSWSDGGAQTHSISSPPSSTTYTASFKTQYTLTTSVAPSGGGSVSPLGNNWYNSGQVVSISATANSGYRFTGWSGDLSGSSSPASITMGGPKGVVANFTAITNSALLELNFEEGTGNTALDSSGRGNHGTINGALYTTGSAVGSYALSFDGNDSVTVQANGSLKPNNISVALWVKHTNSTTSPNYGGIIKGAYGDGYSTGFRMLDYNNQPLAQMNFGDSGPKGILGNPFVQGAWCHLALTYDHAKIRLYQNGVLVREVAETRNIKWNTTPSSLTIGLAQWYLKGVIDKVKICDYALSSQQIGQLYNEKR